MAESIKRLCSICARGNSKGLETKNVRLLLGKPLIVYSIERALESGLFDYVAVSSDSSKILEIAQSAGADILVSRPANLATDEAAKLPSIQHCLIESARKLDLRFDTVCDLDATSPLRLIEDIIGAIQLCEQRRCDNVITGSVAHRSPYFNMVENGPNGFVRIVKSADKPIVRRQSVPDCYDCNASIYVWSRDNLLSANEVVTEQTLLYEMPEERSRDIDSLFDFELVEFLMSKQQLE